ncbi:MAG: hypothetical protein U1D35_01630 [Paracoccaceae bacterium]|nr:hypothetical protein [Paracoccaceae bacterium]
MSQFGLGALVLVLGAALAVFTQASYRAAGRRATLRAGYLDACQSLFRGGLKAVAPTGFPRLSGQVQGLTFDLQVVPDTLTFRKLPALWLLVTLPEKLPLRATFDLMIRPTGVEPFSHFQTLPDQISAPQGFPEDCVIRTDDPAALPPEALLRRHLGLFADLRVKELVISPKGLRLVWLAQEADRTRYLIFRDAEMGQVPLTPETLRPLMSALRDLQADILRDHAYKESWIA